MGRKVVIDSSPVIGLALVGGLEWLPRLFGEVFMPETVRQEVLPGKNAPGELAIERAICRNWIMVWPDPITPKLEIDLDAGETDCINIGLSHPDQVLLVMDERAGRAVANEKGLRAIWYCGHHRASKKARIDTFGKRYFCVIAQLGFSYFCGGNQPSAEKRAGVTGNANLSIGYQIADFFQHCPHSGRVRRNPDSRTTGFTHGFRRGIRLK